ncbi:hypothetical protein QOZ80_7BG0602110 [Eleusine coracana subsp. coracana]|nr:hypothetical protein QOZ80_7BG0602110 [Eleusine coracana subsp. coracana]
MVPAAALLVLVALFPALAAVPADDRRWPAIDDSPVALSPGHICGEHGSYAPGSAYEASMQLLAATIPAKVNADSCNCSNGNTAGDSPDRVVASAFCPWRPGANSSDCGACVALAFREAQRLCPYQRQADVVVDGGACSLNFHDYDRREQEVSMAEPRARDTLFWLENVMEFPDVLLVLLFQAAGLVCVVFLLVLEWRARSRGPGSSDHLPVTGDQ